MSDSGVVRLVNFSHQQLALFMGSLYKKPTTSYMLIKEPHVCFEALKISDQENTSATTIICQGGRLLLSL